MVDKYEQLVGNYKIILLFEKCKVIIFMKTNFSSELRPPSRLLLGPGPSNIHPRVSMALGLPIVSHLDPFFLEVMDDVKELVK